jgi:hypothetical protein
MTSQQRVLQLILLTSIPLLQSLLSPNSDGVRPSLNLKCSRSSHLFAGRNPFSRNENNSFGDSIEKEQKKFSSKSALFSSSGDRLRTRNTRRTEGIPFYDMKPDEVSAVRTISLLGGLLSIVFSRDIWYAVSSFLIINIFATQSNAFGVFIRAVGSRFDALSKESSRKKMVSDIVQFLKTVNESSLLTETPSNRLSIIKNIESNEKLTEKGLEVNDVSLVDASTSIQEISFISGINSNSRIAVEDAESVHVFAVVDPPVTVSATQKATIETAPLSFIPSALSSESSDGISSSPAQASKNVPRTSPVPLEPSLASDAVIKATIEVQAAADAASARLKTWLTQQKSVEEEKKRLKLTVVSEKIRIMDQPRLRDELMAHMAIFVGSNYSDLSSMILAPYSASNDTASTAEVPVSVPVYLGSFSSRAIESTAGTIKDFVAVLTSPGDGMIWCQLSYLASNSSSPF